jgi:hypothetical protein
MIDVLKNSSDPVYNYILVDIHGNVLDNVELTDYEAGRKNYAFGLNHVRKSYVKVGNSHGHTEVKLVLPHE